MDPIYFILIPGLALIASGIVAVFKVATSSDSTVKFLGFEMTTPVPGLIMLGIGAAMIYPPVTELLARQPTITEVVLQTDTGGTEASYGVRCPITIPLEGRISVGGTGGVVSYRFVRTQGLNQPAQASEVRQLNFDAPGTARVSDQITVSIPIGEVYITDTLEIVEPDSRQSVPVEISVVSDPTLPEGPPGPPPDVEPPGGRHIARLREVDRPSATATPYRSCPVTDRMGDEPAALFESTRIAANRSHHIGCGTRSPRRISAL